MRARSDEIVAAEAVLVLHLDRDERTDHVRARERTEPLVPDRLEAVVDGVGALDSELSELALVDIAVRRIAAVRAHQHRPSDEDDVVVRRRGNGGTREAGKADA